MICAGIDAGSRAIKMVLLDGESLEVLSVGVADQGVRQAALADELSERVCADAGVDRGAIVRTIATGYARNLIEFADTTVTEITCHGRGVRRQCPEARTVVEIGGQDSKLLRLDANGSVRDFAMNDRCAAGTGRFLEVVATRLDVPLDRLGELASGSTDPAVISSMCVVFAETEIIGLLAGGRAPADIIAGVQASIAARVAAMAGRKVDEPVIFTGGVAMVPGMLVAMSAALGRPIVVAPSPQMTGALGAAILAVEQARR